ncbi:MBL fold metallo-hydrolase [Deinococcus marmoris]|uniref:MBL fold metallo-hydrolase n=1 Tax=Deinococcus marmoris TaxID=249408 RepID=UPI0004972458|nr:MBL fold metallo-hydrolase [Deinococcus marmoris]
MLTHAHLDHVGALPVVIRRFPKLAIYCTEATARIATLVLGDTLKVTTMQGQLLFSADEMKSTLERLRPVPYFTWVSDHGFAFTLFPSGHLLGAASVLIESGSRAVFHTGDVSNSVWAGSSRRVSPPLGVRWPLYGTQTSTGPSLSALT